MEKIRLGSGTLYCYEYAGIMPSNATLEAIENRLGFIQGGASLEYKPEFYEATDDLGNVSKTILTKEEAILKSGVMTWDANTLAKLCATARVTETNGLRTVKIGGIANNNGKKYILHFLHEDAVDGDVRVTIVGQNQAGFTLAFAKDKETVIDAEFKAQPQDTEGTLITFSEEIVSFGALTVTTIAGTTGKTKVSVISPTLTVGNSYLGKIGASAETVVYDAAYSSGWTAVVPGTTEFAATTGQVLSVIEIDSSNKAKKVGYKTIIDVIG